MRVKNGFEGSARHVAYKLITTGKATICLVDKLKIHRIRSFVYFMETI